MKYTEETNSYNERRYGKPWIAKLDFSAPGKPTYTFGSWLGVPGSSGELSIEVEAGDVIATGQKDHRKSVSPQELGVVQPDGTALVYQTLVGARDASLALLKSLAAPIVEPEIDLLALGM